MKFRVYDKQEKKYADYQPHFYIDSNGDLFFDKNKMVIHEDLWLCDPDRYVVEFSTGLKDKNGVEIYENDLARNNRFMVAEIKYALNNACFYYCYNDELVCFSEINSDTLEIIGNIHGEADGKD